MNIFLIVAIICFHSGCQLTTSSDYYLDENLQNEETFKKVILHDSIISPIKVSIFRLDKSFSSPFLGNDVQDNYYKLYRGEKINMNQYDKVTLTNDNDIKNFISEINQSVCVYKPTREKTTLMGNVMPFIFRDKLQINKNIVIHGMIILYFKDRTPMIIFDCAQQYIYINGYKFKLRKDTYYKHVFDKIKNSDDDILY